MRLAKWYVLLASSLAVISAGVYITQVFLFHKPGDTLFYLFQDLAFVPVQVLLVMLIIDRLLRKKEKEQFLNKLNMIIGVFFNQVGTGLISLLAEAVKNISPLADEMRISGTWNDARFRQCRKFVTSFEPDIEVNPGYLGRLREYLESRKSDLLTLLENPNLLEHDRFTDLLWAVFHLADELSHRESLSGLPDSDIHHLKGDMARAYRFVVAEWVDYMKHLKKDYPYLFSVAVRTNPFDDDAEVVICG